MNHMTVFLKVSIRPFEHASHSFTLESLYPKKIQAVRRCNPVPLRRYANFRFESQTSTK